LFLEKAADYFRDLGLNPPVKQFSGRGYHSLFALPEIKVEENPDITDRIRLFAQNYRNEFEKDLKRLDAKMDNTQDLRRVVKISGTAKPDVGIISRLYADKRVEEEALKEYLYQLSLPDPKIKGNMLTAGHVLPDWFQYLLKSDPQIKALYDGIGKPKGTDCSSSGYDYSLTKHLMQRGHRNLDDLATIIFLRPQGSIQKNGKGEGYVRHTLANALLK